MIISYNEKHSSNHNGTIIDFETIGDFYQAYSDSREYQDIIPVIFGYITNELIHIDYTDNKDTINDLYQIIAATIPKLTHPLFAFNTHFEQSICFHQFGLVIVFDGELNKRKYESKKTAVKRLKIPNYKDPFFDDGYACIPAWKNGKFDQCVAHNRSCLLKERDILIKRGYRLPSPLELIS